MKYVILVCTEYNRDEPTHTYFGRDRGEVMQQFRRDFAEFIDDWKHFSDDELVQRCTYNGVGMHFDEHEVSAAPIETGAATEGLAVQVAGVLQERGYDHGLDLYYRDDGEEIIVVCDGGPRGQAIATVMFGNPVYYVEIAWSSRERPVLALADQLCWAELPAPAGGWSA